MYILHISYFFVLVHILSSILVCVLYIHTIHSWYLSRIRTAIACNELHLLLIHLDPWIKTKNFICVSKMIIIFDDNDTSLRLQVQDRVITFFVCFFSLPLGSLDPRKRFWYMKSNVNLSSITKRALRLVSRTKHESCTKIVSYDPH